MISLKAILDTLLLPMIPLVVLDVGMANHAGSHTFTNVMDYITMANAGNATDFGDLLQNLMFGQAGVISNNTIGIFGVRYDTFYGYVIKK